MKRIQIMILILCALLIMLTACNTNENSQAELDNDLFITESTSAVNKSEEKQETSVSEETYKESTTDASVSGIDESNTEKNDDADVTEIVYVDAIWTEPDEEEMYNDCDVIADVTIKSLEEIAISYIFMDAECTSYKTLATVSVNKIYYSAEENISQEFIVAIPNSSYEFHEDFPKTEIGESCIFFISSTVGLDDSLELYNYADYYLGHPADIININGLECNADEIFSHYSDNSVPVIKEPDIELLEGEELDPEYQSYGLKTGRCSMPLSDFEDTLIEKINEKIRSN